MQVRLRDDSPWKKVTLQDGYEIYSYKFVDLADHDISPIRKWIIFKEDTPDYSTYSKTELVEVAKKFNLSYTGLSKDALLKLILENS